MLKDDRFIYQDRLGTNIIEKLRTRKREVGSFFAVLPFDASYSATASDGAGGSAQTVAVGDCVNVRGAVVDSSVRFSLVEGAAATR